MKAADRIGSMERDLASLALERRKARIRLAGWYMSSASDVAAVERVETGVVSMLNRRCWKWFDLYRMTGLRVIAAARREVEYLDN